MQKKIIYFVFVFLLTWFLFPQVSFAKVGVGVGTGKIEFDKPLKPGGLYTLPVLTVINTGDEAGDYGVSIEYQTGKLDPPREWFVFKPAKFYLEAGQSQVVEVQTNIPPKANPGDYFAFLSAHPIEKTDTPGGAKVEISAAAKMYFTVAPANIFQGILYRLNSLWFKYAPWTYIFAAALLLSIVLAILNRFITLNIGIGKKKKIFENVINENKNEQQEDLNSILITALSEVENYTTQLSEIKFRTAFIEARKNRQAIIDFFYKNNGAIVSRVSPELRNILIFSKNGLEQVKYKGKDVYEKVLKMVVTGIVD